MAVMSAPDCGSSGRWQQLARSRAWYVVPRGEELCTAALAARCAPLELDLLGRVENLAQEALACGGASETRVRPSSCARR